MGDDRKYRQHGYMDQQDPAVRGRDDQRPRGPKLPIDVTGPRLPRMVQTVVAARCYNCSTTLPPGFDFSGSCPKCNAALHCCKQCANFEPSARLQCLKTIPARIAVKDKENDCALFETRVTVARDSTSVTTSPYAPTSVTPRTPQDARAAFDNLFKK